MEETKERVTVYIGDPVMYTDQYGKPHCALVTAVHGFNSVEDRNENHKKQWEQAKEAGQSWATDEWLERNLNPNLPLMIPSINLVYVEGDVDKTDSYGRQIVRQTSVTHRTNQSAHGRFWESVA